MYAISNAEALVLELEEWCYENFGDDTNPKCKRYERRMPRNIKGVKMAKESEEETKEQREMRLARAIYANPSIRNYKKDGIVPKEARELIARYKRLEEMYMSDERIKRSKKKISGQALGQATYDASTPDCVKMASVIEELMQRREIGGEIDSE